MTEIEEFEKLIEDIIHKRYKVPVMIIGTKTYIQKNGQWKEVCINYKERNFPCCCGSGKKYKKCCIGIENEE
jgi:uncharacterized protein YecA (UPF0149 family)